MKGSSMKKILIVLTATLLLSACKMTTTTQVDTAPTGTEASGEQLMNESALESTFETDTVLQAPELSNDDEVPALSAELNATGIVEENFE